MTTQTRKITVDEFWTMPDQPGHRYELVDGELVDMDGAPRHGKVTVKIGSLLSDHVIGNDLPLDVGVATGFQMDPYTLRFPDVYVTSWGRMSTYDEDAGGWPRFAPDVAIEVVSPSNSPAALARKTREYFANGARSVWIADPGPRTVTIRRSDGTESVFNAGDTVSGEPEIAGFSCAVTDIFAVLDRMPKPANEERT